MRRHNKSVLLVAALIAALLLGTGIAATRLGLFDVKSETAEPIVPIEGAEETVVTDLGSTENELVKLTVEEAAFDGQGLLVKLRLAAKDAERYALYNSWMQMDPEGEYETEWIPVEVEAGRSEYLDEYTIVNEPDDKRLLAGGEEVPLPEGQEDAQAQGLPVYLEDGALYYADFAELRTTGRKDGKAIISYAPDISVEGGEDAFYTFSYRAQEQPDGSVFIWMDGVSEAEISAESLKLSVGAKLSADGAQTSLDEIEVSIPRMDEMRKYRIEPVGDGQGERFRILGGEVCFTHVRGYLTLDYDYESLPEELMGIDFYIYDEAGERINTGDGSLGGAEAPYRMSCEMQSFAEPPETIYFEAKVIDGDVLGERVACRLIPE